MEYKAKDKIKTGKMERRTYTAPVEIRAEGDEEGRTVEGYAAVFDEETDMWWWKERVAPGAFSDVLKDDVRALFNHDPNLILARSSNTLELWQDDRGLGYRFEAPDTTAGNDLLENIRNGNVSQSSFGFTIDAYEWEEREDDDLITITKVGRLFDVSPVTFPAYETTEVTARSMEQYRDGEDTEKQAGDSISFTVSGEELLRVIEGAVKSGGGKQLLMFDERSDEQETRENETETQSDDTTEEDPQPQRTVNDDIEFYRLRLAELEE